MEDDNDPDLTVPEFNPYRPPSASHPGAERSFRRDTSLTWLRNWSIFLLLTIGIGSPLAWFYSIESIVASGPFALVFGLLVTASGLKRRRLATILFGGITILFVIFVFSLINLNHWSPSEADRPVSLMIVVFDLFAVPSGLLGMQATDRADRNR